MTTNGTILCELNDPVLDLRPSPGHDRRFRFALVLAPGGSFVSRLLRFGKPGLGLHPGAFVAMLILSLAVPAQSAALTGLWTFDNGANPGQAAVGTDLDFQGVAPTHSNFLADVGGVVQAGVVTTAPAGSGNSVRANHGITPNGGGASVNQYSIVVDLFSPEESRDSWRAIFQTNVDNVNDADYFIRPDDDIGVDVLRYSGESIDETAWTRLVLTVDLTKGGNDAVAYLDGNLHYTHSPDRAIDGRFSLGAFLYFFADNDGENHPLHLGALAIYEGVLSAAAVSILGDAGSPIPAQFSAGASAPFALDTRNLAKGAGITMGTGVVGVLADDGAGSLRDSIAGASVGDTLSFDPGLTGQTLTLGGTPLTVDRNLTIDASALPGGFTISGDDASRVFEINSPHIVCLESLTISNGNVGGVRNAGVLTLKNSTISGNNNSGGPGGGIVNLGPGTLTVANSTIAGNASSNGGGGIQNIGSLIVWNSTISGNSGDAGGSGILNSGATSTAEIVSSTIVANLGSSGGLRNDSGTATIENSIIARNGNRDLHGTFMTRGANLIGSNQGVEAAFPAGNPNAHGDLVGTSGTSLDPFLAPLDYYGGLTFTMPPLPGSPVVEGAVPLGSTPPTDQLGHARPNGPLPDLGAVEAIPFSNGPGFVDSDGDLLDDRLEVGIFGNLTEADANSDSDVDGKTDATELADMTDPLDSNDLFRILSIGPAAGFDAQSNPLVTVVISTFPGLEYKFETNGTLLNFEPVVPDSTFTADDFTATFELRFNPGERNFVRAGRK